MKLSITLKHCKLPLKYPFTTSRYTVTNQDTIIVALSNGEYTGYGEATANPYYKSSVEKLKTSINSIKHYFDNIDIKDPKIIWEDLKVMLKDDYFALCAIDCAYWDFYAKLNKRTIRSFWSDANDKTPLSNYTIGIDTLTNMIRKIKEASWPVYKIKLGTSNDVEIIEELRKNTKAIFRVDSNCAWSVDETLKNAEALKKLGVEFIEQPLVADDWDGMRVLKEKSVLPIIADESCQRLEDVKQCAEVFDGVNIKLMKCGGISPALKMIEIARSKNIKVMAGCMTESSVGISNLTQLAPLLDYIDADGALLLEKDIANGVTIKNGEIIFSKNNGSGVISLTV